MKELVRESLGTVNEGLVAARLVSEVLRVCRRVMAGGSVSFVARDFRFLFVA